MDVRADGKRAARMTTRALGWAANSLLKGMRVC